MKLKMIFGSNSDQKKILPGIVAATEVIPDLEVRIEYASADNTPEKVDEVMLFAKGDPSMLLEKGDNPTVLITGAGMSNVLTGVAKGYSTVNDLIIGVPITDSATGGLSSLLSTSEKPPLNPVLSVALDNTYAACHIAYRFIKGGFESVVIADTSNIKDFRDFSVDKKTIESVERKVSELKLSYVTRSIQDIAPYDLVITPFSHQNLYNHGSESRILNFIDGKLRRGNGIQIGVREKAEVKRWEHYTDCLKDLSTTGIVGIGRYENAAIVAAQIMRDETALGIVHEKKYGTDPDNPGKKMKLELHPGLTVKAGQVYEGGK